MSTCLAADDLWLKTMELMNGVPVVVACEYKGLHYVKDSQVVGLRYTNVDRNENEVQLERISQWLEQTYEKGIWTKWLTDPGRGEDLSSIVKVCEVYTKGQERDRRRIREANRKLRQSNAEKSRLNKKLRIAWDEKRDRGVQIKELKKQQKELKKQISALKKQISALKKENAALKKKNKAIKQSTIWKVGRIVTWPGRKLKRLLKKLRKK